MVNLFFFRAALAARVYRGRAHPAVGQLVENDKAADADVRAAALSCP
ncbi:MAG: hypothetical protein KF914_19180 [Rhizobiaceae bacterium]|nr:hypothetical protein [Rhizobiaceae bacterium]